MGSPPPIQFATLGMWDTLLLMVLALVVFGPRRLPTIGRQLGKLMYEFRKASNDFKFQMEEELRTAEEADRRKKAEEERQRALAVAPAPAQLEATTSQTPASAAETPGAAGTKPAAETQGTAVTQEAAATQETGIPAATEMPGTAAKTDSPTVPESTHSAETAPQAEQSTGPAPASPIPQIQPPSTGEKIAANPPGKTQGDLFPEAEGSEPAAHHG
jgi:sec-independent protein translocase protein TatB